MRQDFRAVGRYKHIIFDADAAQPFDINARFHRPHLPRDDLLLRHLR